MTNSIPKCRHCDVAMTIGFTLDKGDSGFQYVSCWIEGVPDEGFFGLKITEKNIGVVQTYRCSECGYLENYARELSVKKWWS